MVKGAGGEGKGGVVGVEIEDKFMRSPITGDGVSMLVRRRTRGIRGMVNSGLAILRNLN